MGGLAAIWSNVLTTVKAAGENVLNAAENAAAANVGAVRTAVGGAVQQTGIGVGEAIAPAGSAPSMAAWMAQNWPIVAVGAVVLLLVARGGGR